ncbi:DUF393 domain-containing protein [Skeletonema marinoi]|uniref:DUF393 domain-containing protein n=1 Tax=Skeletonema marinoi TaxID=267567 RepID=A0AAD8Y766_9STRA|nr:DUF393 domain-containing protein [Skeletonema marinoi]
MTKPRNMVKHYLLLLCTTLLLPPGNALLPSSVPGLHSLHIPQLHSCTAAIKPIQKLHSSSSNNVHLNEQDLLFPEKLNIIYDSKCSVCQWEVDYLKQRMQNLSTRTNSNKSNNLIRFTDLEANEGYNESDPANGGVTYTMGMTSFHAVKSNGEILHGVPVFVEAYDIVDQGWIWEVTKWPIVGTLASWGYDMFAKIRTQLTRGSSVERLIEEHYTRRNEIMMKNNDGVGEVCEPCQNKIASEENEGR